jgi:hypothetical protein
MLHMFQWFLNVFRRFSQVFQTLVSIVSSVYFMLQLLLLNISKVHRVLYMICMWEAASSADDIWSGVGDVRDDVDSPQCSLASSTR